MSRGRGGSEIVTFAAFDTQRRYHRRFVLR